MSSQVNNLVSTMTGLEQRVILLEQQSGKVDSSAPQCLCTATPLIDMLAGCEQHRTVSIAARCNASFPIGRVRSRLAMVVVNCLAQIDTLEKTWKEL